MCKKINPLLLITMAFIVISLLSALTPISDFDQDGHLDSLVTEGFIFIPILCSAVILFSLWIKLPLACLIVPQQFSVLIVPPPIPTE